jgi:hypothetical protein
VGETVTVLAANEPSPLSGDDDNDDGITATLILINQTKIEHVASLSLLY